MRVAFVIKSLVILKCSFIRLPPTCSLCILDVAVVPFQQRKAPSARFSCFNGFCISLRRHVNHPPLKTPSLETVRGVTRGSELRQAIYSAFRIDVELGTRSGVSNRSVSCLTLRLLGFPAVQFMETFR
ncbi:hypothetical protein TNCV_48281 [Trichonephila clavipes]|nr:hypothetical protein TNCV_48281 [Trichonephila clavipes]